MHQKSLFKKYMSVEKYNFLSFVKMSSDNKVVDKSVDVVVDNNQEEFESLKVNNDFEISTSYPFIIRLLLRTPLFHVKLIRNQFFMSSEALQHSFSHKFVNDGQTFFKLIFYQIGK